MSRISRVFFFILLMVGASLPAFSQAARPKLILVLVIDQFRADYLTRFENRFLPPQGPSESVGGFRYLMNQGAYFPYGEYDLLQCMTGPGHATILTGAYPYQNGISINEWYDSASQNPVYCAEDRASAIVGPESASTKIGVSPKNMLGTTVGDEIKNAGIPSRQVAIALKDRAAIFMGGHRADLALWMDGKSVQWISTRYYLPDGKLPTWVDALNAVNHKRVGEKIDWTAQGPGNGLSAKKAMALAKDKSVVGMGLEFPHRAELGSRASFALPIGLELTEKAAESALDAMKLGNGAPGGTDVLAVSFSSHDYLGHAFGPNSREMEEMTVADDRVIAKLLNHVRTRLPGGLRDVVVVLTGDHGAPPNPDWLRANRITSGRIDDEELARALSTKMDEKFGKPSQGAKWVPFSADFNFYINRVALKEKGLDQRTAENFIKEQLLKVEGVAHVFSSSDYADRKLPPGMHQRQILKTYYPGRSGDVILIPKPFYEVGVADTVSHVTGYSYDRTVPIILAGPGIRTGRYATRAEVVDIAPTLTFLVGSVPPSLSEGRVLHEALSTGARKSP